jgi:hypothetical protein
MAWHTFPSIATTGTDALIPKNYLVHYQFNDPVPPFPNYVSSSYDDDDNNDDAAANNDNSDNDDRNLKQHAKCVISNLMQSATHLDSVNLALRRRL